jgi:hypothetical protein
MAQAGDCPQAYDASIRRQAHLDQTRTIQNFIVLHGEQFDVRLHAEGLRLIQNTQIREILAIN